MADDTLARVPHTAYLSASSPEMVALIDEAAGRISQLPQIDLVTDHVLHGGMYARTIRIPAGAVVTGALIKIPTLLVIQGDADVLTGDGWVAVSGFGVLAGSAGRKQAFVTRSAVELTMMFPTQARTVEEAERECTDEHEQLMSRKSERDTVLVTGE